MRETETETEKEKETESEREREMQRGHTPATTATQRAICLQFLQLRGPYACNYCNSRSTLHMLSKHTLRMLSKHGSRRLSRTAYAAAAVAYAGEGPSSPSDNPN